MYARMAAAIFSFSLHPLAKEILEKTFPPRVILPRWGEAHDSRSIASARRHRSDHGDDI